jgi:hypothetical protein
MNRKNNNDASFLGALQILADNELYAKGNIKTDDGRRMPTIVRLSQKGKFPMPVKHLLNELELYSDEVKGLYVHAGLEIERQRFRPVDNYTQELVPQGIVEFQYRPLYEGVELQNRQSTLTSTKFVPKLEFRRLNNPIFTITCELDRQYVLNINGNKIGETVSHKDIIQRGSDLLIQGFTAQRSTRNWEFRPDNGYLLDLGIRVFETRMEQVFGVRRSTKVFLPDPPAVIITECITTIDIDSIC